MYNYSSPYFDALLKLTRQKTKILFSIEELRSDFAGYEIIELIEQEIELNEGLYHNGKGAVVRFVGRKI